MKGRKAIFNLVQLKIGLNIMKKFMYVTSALVGLASAVANADTPVVTVGGGVDFQAGIISQSSTYKTSGTRFDNDAHTVTNMRLDVKAEGKTDYGMLYGSVVEIRNNGMIEVPNLGGSNGLMMYVRKAYGFMESDMARLELGSVDPVSARMQAGPNSFNVATGGVNGDAFDYINYNVGQFSNNTEVTYLNRALLPSDMNSGTGVDGVKFSNKVNLLTPRVGGFQVGVSYTRDTNETGAYTSLASKYSTTNSATAQGTKDVFTGTINYSARFDEFDVKANISGEVGKAKKNQLLAAAGEKYRDLKAFEAGLMLGYAGFKLGGSYVDWGKSLLLNGTSNNFDNWKTHGYTVGAAYENGPVGLSVTYVGTERQKNKFNMLSVGADYRLAQGVMPYIEGNFFKIKPGATTVTSASNSARPVDNKGNVVLFGLKTNF
jgi:hypothetical protein